MKQVTLQLRESERLQRNVMRCENDTNDEIRQDGKTVT
jgi:hypothetical protein